MRESSVRDAFAPAKQKAPAVIFTGGLNAIGNEPFDAEKAGDMEVQRIMLELLSLLYGLSSSADISDGGNRPGWRSSPGPADVAPTGQDDGVPACR